MVGVQVSPNIKKKRVRVDIHGNEIDPISGEILGHVDPPVYTPTPAELASAQARTGGETKLTPEEKAAITSGQPVPATPSQPAQAQGGSIAQAVQNALREQVQIAVADALKQIDIGAMIKDTIKDAFK